MVNCINLIIEMSPRFVLGRENVPCVAEVVNRSLKADWTDFTTMCPKEQQTSDNLVVKYYCFITEIFDKFIFTGILRGCLSHLNEA